MKLFNLHENISIYLKSLENLNSASPHTLRSYRLDLQQAFALVPHENISCQDFLKLCRQAQTGWGKLSLASRNRKTSCLKSFCNWAYAQSLLDQDLSHFLHSPKVPRHIPTCLSVDETMAVLNHLQSHPELLQKEVLFLVLYGAGLRISEACGIRWKDIQWSRRAILVLGKGQKERWVLAPQMVFDRLRDWQKQSLPQQDFVFYNQKSGQGLGTRQAYAWIHQLGQEAGLLRPLHPHALRHSFATHLLTSGANLRTLQQLLGHSNLASTEKYTHLNTDHLARTMGKTHPLHKKAG
ncbi:MAG: tyrosine-type recombinase/integrase [Pseudobdellovibrionaceae bacterium]